MNWFSNLKIGPRLIGAFVIVALVGGVVGLIGVTKIHELDAKDTQLYEQGVAPAEFLVEAVDNFQRYRRNTREVLLSPAGERQGVVDHANERRTAVDKALESYATSLIRRPARPSSRTSRAPSARSTRSTTRPSRSPSTARTLRRSST